MMFVVTNKYKLSGRVVAIFTIIFLTNFLFSITINVPADQPTIQAGIDIAADGDVVLVAEGTYYENINFNGKAITVASNFLIDEDESHIENTIINGSQATDPDFSSCVLFSSGEGNDSVITGFTLTEGGGSFEPGVGMFGGGVSMHNSSPHLENLIITNNVITGISGGSGIYCSMSSPSISNVIISNNSSGFGAGFFCFGSSTPSLENVAITDNLSSDDGGGIFCNYNVNLSLENVIISRNISEDDGGGICCWQNSDISLVNVLIFENFAADSGGGISFWLNCDLNLIDVTISGNSTNGEGGGIYCGDSSEPELVNCILWNNSPEEIFISSSSLTATYSDIQGGWAGEGNIDEDPLFVGTGDHPFSLQDLSSCVNAGIQDTTGFNLPEFDLAGNPRVYGGRIDMGAYENQNVIVGANENLIPLITKLNQNYPNPFNPNTEIRFTAKSARLRQGYAGQPEGAKIEIYNLKGQRIREFKI